eukprot:NODE_2437_length_1177_cov_39.903810_g2322_i0.p1 GENE.NODE_2437_length_1177_cov_39.903810_g2322_i0~~NODE_2437_length_1177_cov_39.903810_g2322_i0.p1  ORF type:complete len:353 (+),score=90.27 NODE_2437_length_1177_cov_39.903810_g2322_i0:46-1104(+)
MHRLYSPPRDSYRAPQPGPADYEPQPLFPAIHSLKIHGPVTLPKPKDRRVSNSNHATILKFTSTDRIHSKPLVRTPGQHQVGGVVLCLASLDDTLLCSDVTKTVAKWNFDDQLALQMTFGYTVWCVCVFRGQVALGCGDGCVRLWNKGPTNVQELWGHEQVVRCLTVFNNHLYSASCDATVRKWDGQRCVIVWDQREKAQAVEHKEVVTAMVVYGTHLYLGTSDGALQKWNAADEFVATMKPGHRSAIRAMVVFNNCLYTAGADHTIKKWNESHFLSVLNGHRGPVTTLLTFADALYSGSADKSVKKWDTSDECAGTLTRAHGSTITTMTQFQDALYTGGEDRKVHKWRLPD